MTDHGDGRFAALLDLVCEGLNPRAENCFGLYGETMRPARVRIMPPNLLEMAEFPMRKIRCQKVRSAADVAA